MKYYLIIYLWRPVGHKDWNIANERYKGSLVSWFEEMRGYESQEFRLLNAVKLSKTEYDDFESLD